MKTKQYSIKVFEIKIENEDEFIDFIDKNSTLFKNYLLYLEGNLTKKIEDFLEKRELNYTTNIPKRRKEEKSSFQKTSGLKIVDSVVRSGQEIVVTQDILILKRVNSGSHIKTEGNFIALSIVEGNVECNGEFMILKASSKSSIVFHGVDITNDLEEDSFYKIVLNGNEIIISKYSKDIKWA